MDWLDYREKLGVGFSDDRKFRYFKTKIFNILRAVNNDPYSGCLDYEEYYSFCNTTGIEMDLSLSEDYNSPDRFQHCLNVLEHFSSYSTEFLLYYVALTNSVKTEKFGSWKRINFVNLLKKMLTESHIPYEVLEEKGQYFVFPKGAKELDDALVSEPLAWLSAYPTAHKMFVIALKQYSEGTYIRDTADNLRKALEAFFQEFLGNGRNLETNKSEICRYLGSQNVDAGIAGLFQPLINAYKNINDSLVKHNDAIDPKLLEFLLYQTGLLIRMVLSVYQAEQEAQDDAD